MLAVTVHDSLIGILPIFKVFRFCGSLPFIPIPNPYLFSMIDILTLPLNQMPVQAITSADSIMAPEKHKISPPSLRDN